MAEESGGVRSLSWQKERFMTRRLAIVAALAVFVGTLPALAQGPGQRFGGPGRAGRGGPGLDGPGPALMPMLHRLNLTDTQKEQLHALMEENRPSGDAAQQMRDAEQKLHAALLSDTPDLQAIETAKAALNAAHAAELDQRIAMMQKIAQILTAEQRQELLKLQSQGPPAGGRN
jgi:Spy/CpxP family protein refolding chaperone